MPRRSPTWPAMARQGMSLHGSACPGWAGLGEASQRARAGVTARAGATRGAAWRAVAGRSGATQGKPWQCISRRDTARSRPRGQASERALLSRSSGFETWRGHQLGQAGPARAWRAKARRGGAGQGSARHSAPAQGMPRQCRAMQGELALARVTALEGTIPAMAPQSTAPAGVAGPAMATQASAWRRSDRQGTAIHGSAVHPTDQLETRWKPALEHHQGGPRLAQARRRNAWQVPPSRCCARRAIPPRGICPRGGRTARGRHSWRGGPRIGRARHASARRTLAVPGLARYGVVKRSGRTHVYGRMPMVGPTRPKGTGRCDESVEC